LGDLFRVNGLQEALGDLREGLAFGGLHDFGFHFGIETTFQPDQTSGFGRIEAIGATIGVPRDIHVRPNVVGFGISQMAKRTIAEDLGV
jgi:hypothetical protein